MTPPALDPNLNPYRQDLAASKLKGIVAAPRYVDPVQFQVTAGVASLRRAGADDSEQLSQALHGEIIDIYDEVDGYGWGQMHSDGYVGWFDMAALSRPVLATSHKVRTLRTYAFSDPHPKAPPHFLLSLGAQVCGTDRIENGFVFCERTGWVYLKHLGELDQNFADAISVAEQFLEAPYQWGGVESLGLDCSGLVQTAYKATGKLLLRDSYMQRTMGEDVAGDKSLNHVKRGDIICWSEHVALVVDPTTIIHANSFLLKVAKEPLNSAVERICSQYGPILSIRRLVG